MPAGAIVAAHELTPSDLLQLSQQGVAGLCMAEGGATSHVAILARGKGLPCMVALGSTLLDQQQGQPVVLDADGGRLELTPSTSAWPTCARLQTSNSNNAGPNNRPRRTPPR